MEEIPSIAMQVIQQLSGRLEKTESLLEQTNLASVEQRLASYLLEASGGNETFTLELSKGDLASLLGMSQETLSRRLSVLQQEQVISLQGQRSITICDRQALELLGDR
jgi:CRP/FNR family transcriptional regulator